MSPCGIFYQQLKEIDRALGTMRRLGVSELSDAYGVLYKARGELLAKIGFKFPRSVLQLVKLAGLSPGSITLWEDIESGWLAEARAGPGAPPVYRRVDDETAAAILKGELTKELEERLMKPDDYIGE